MRNNNHEWVALNQAQPTPAYRRHMRDVAVMKFVRQGINKFGPRVCCEAVGIAPLDSQALAKKCLEVVSGFAEPNINQCETLVEEGRFFPLMNLLLRK